MRYSFKRRRFLIAISIFCGALVLLLFSKKIKHHLSPIPPSPYNSNTPYYNAEHGIFVFKGTYREIGKQYATAVPMKAYLNQSREYLNKADDADRDQIIKEIESAEELLTKRFPIVLEMMYGICDVYPNYFLKEVILLNFCSTLTDWEKWNSCGAVAFDENGKIVLGQNLNLGPSNNFSTAYMIPKNGLAFFIHVNPGYVWFSTGVNEAGFCVGGASVNANYEDDFKGNIFPNTMIQFYLLTQARNVDEALGPVEKRTPRGPFREGLNLLLADRSGTLINIELTYNTIIKNNIDKFFIATSHFRTRQLSSINRRINDLCKLLEKNSTARYHHALNWLKTNPSVKQLRYFLRDTSGGGAWCRAARNDDVGYTSASYIIDFSNGNFEYWIGTTESNPAHNILPLKILYNREAILDKPNRAEEDPAEHQL